MTSVSRPDLDSLAFPTSPAGAQLEDELRSRGIRLDLRSRLMSRQLLSTGIAVDDVPALVDVVGARGVGVVRDALAFGHGWDSVVQELPSPSEPPEVGDRGMAILATLHRSSGSAHLATLTHQLGPDTPVEVQNLRGLGLVHQAERLEGPRSGIWVDLKSSTLPLAAAAASVVPPAPHATDPDLPPGTTAAYAQSERRTLSTLARLSDLEEVCEWGEQLILPTIHHGTAAHLESVLRSHLCMVDPSSTIATRLRVLLATLRGSDGDYRVAQALLTCVGPAADGELHIASLLVGPAAKIRLAADQFIDTPPRYAGLAAHALLNAVSRFSVHGDLTEAEELLDAAFERAVLVEDQVVLGRCHLAAARVAALRDDLSTAANDLSKAVSLVGPAGLRVLAHAVVFAVEPRDGTTAQRSAAAGITIGTHLARQAAEHIDPEYRDRLAWVLHPFLDAVDAADLPDALAQGHDTTTVELIAASTNHRSAAALRQATAPAPTRPATTSEPMVQVSAQHKLSPREHEVATLVAEALTNDQIARRLGISRWTVVNHLRNVMRKLDCTSRLQVAARLLSTQPVEAAVSR